MSSLTLESASKGVFQGNGDDDGGRQSLSNETGICIDDESQAQNVTCVADANKTLVTNQHSPLQQTDHMETPSIIDNHSTPTSLPTNANLSFTPTNTISEPKLTTNSSLATHDVIEFCDPLSPVNFRYINPRDGHMMASILPPDLKFVETSELLPMAYDDFTKCLEEDLRRSPREKHTSAEDDCVVPSVSPKLQAASGGRCVSSCSESSSDESHHYDLDSMEAKKLVKSRRSLSCNSPYGTLNWGLSPTIIYKTPDYERSVNVGNGCMKCSISEGNVELITPPQSSHSRLRRSRRRKLRRRGRRKSLNFGDMIDEGVQEVPTNADKENEKNRDSDSISNDPMWFKEDSEWEVCFKDEDLRIHEEDLMECFANLKNALPKSQETESREQILNVAVDCIRNLQERITGRRTGRNVSDNEQELSEKLGDFQEAEDIFGVLPQFSWSDIDEPCYEIQAILDSLPLVPDTTIDDNAPSTISPTIEPKTKKKRKYSKRASTKQKPVKKPKRKLTEEKQDTASENMNSSDLLASEVPSLTSASSLDDSQGSWCLSPHDQCQPMTTIIHRSTPMLSPSPNSTPYCPITTAIPLQTLGTPLILPKPSPITCFSPPATSGHVLSTTSRSPLLPSFVPVLPAGVSIRSFQTSPLLPRVPLVHTGLSIPVPSPSFPGSSRLLPLTSSAMAQHPLAWYQTGKPLSVQEWWDSSDSEGRYEKSEKAAKKKTIPNGYMLFCKEKRNGLNTENPELKSRPGVITKLLSKKWKQLRDEERRPYEKKAMKMRCNENEWIMETP